MKCARHECNFERHPDALNNGGTHCCKFCKIKWEHGALCTKKVISKKELPNKTIVVSHYKSDRFEDLLLFFPKYRVIIYDKSDTPDTVYSSDSGEIVKLDNIGREGHTYLTHIIDNYDCLTDYTVFIQDDTDNHIISYPIFQEETDAIILSRFPFHQYETTWNCGSKVQKRIIKEGVFNLHTLPSPTAIRDSCLKLGLFLPKEYMTETGAFFVVQRDVIKKRPKSFYEKVREWLLENDKNGFVLEHIWKLIFSKYEV